MQLSRRWRNERTNERRSERTWRGGGGGKGVCVEGVLVVFEVAVFFRGFMRTLPTFYSIMCVSVVED